MYVLLAGLYTLAASLIWGVNTLYLLHVGLSIGEVFVANAAYSLGMVLFEIPTGVVADTVGRRASFLLSLGILASTTALYLVLGLTRQGIVPFTVVSLFVGLGFTFYSGALEAWLVDALDAVGGGDLDRIFARAQQATGVAMVVGTVGGGLLGQINLALPFVVRSGLLVGVIAVAVPLMREQGFTPRPLVLAALPQELRQQARAGIAHCWNRPGLRQVVLASSLVTGFMFWGFYAAQPYLLGLFARDAVWLIGLVTAALSLATVAGNQLVDIAARWCHRRSTLLAWAVAVLGAAAIAMGSTKSFGVALIAYLTIGVALGIFEPVHHGYVNTVTPSRYRATVLSFDSMLGSVGGAGTQLGLGRLSEVRSLAFGYVVGGVVPLLALPLLFVVRRVGGSGDRVAARAPVESVAAAGLPGITQVEARPAPEES